MLSDKLQAIVDKHTEQGKVFWADKPKLNESELRAIAELSIRNTEPINRFMREQALRNNPNDHEDILL